MYHNTLYKMSRNAYLPFKDRESLMPWKAEDHHYDNGLMFIHYRNEGTNEDVIAFRGTDMSKLNNLAANLWTNLGLFVGRSPDTTESAIQVLQEKFNTSFFKKISAFIRSGTRNQWYFTGHDLGGGLAIDVVVKNFSLLQDNLKEIVVFEIGGCQHLVKDINLEPYLTVYLTSPNLINTRGKHIPGTVVHVPPSFRDDDGELALYQEKFRHVCHSIINTLVSLMLIVFFIDYVIRHFLEEKRLTLLLVAMVYSVFSPLLSLIEKMLPVKPEVLLKSVLSIVPMNPLATLLKSWFSDLNMDTDFPWLVVLFLIAVYSVASCQEWDRVMRQHPIRAMDNKFRAASEDGLPQGAIRMESWPIERQLLQHFLIDSPLQFFNPLSGIGKIFLPAKQIELERNRAIPGFKEEKEIEPPVTFRRLLDIKR